MESDWKKFSALVPEMRERYITEQNLIIRRLLDAPGKTETERFWDTYEEMEKEAQTLHWCLDGHSRSKMWLFMLSMRKVGMLKKEDLVGFSTELQNQIFPEENEKLS